MKLCLLLLIAEALISPTGLSAVEPVRIVMLGDSLPSGFGISKAEAYPTLVQQKINDVQLPFEVVNAGTSGDTSADGLLLA